MMTFKFTGALGQLLDPEPLTSGMVGKPVHLEFDSSWNGLDKVVVFSAGTVTRHLPLSGGQAEIPGEVLAHPWHRLLVGVLGNDRGGVLVVPSEMVVGPLITQGADPKADPLYSGN